MELYQAVRVVRPESSVEIGFAQGVSATAILKATDDNGTGIHHIIDPFQAGYQDCGLQMVKAAGLAHRMVFHRKFAEEVIPSIPTLDFAFIDASHLFDLSISEFVLVDKKLRVGGVVGFHDMWMPSQQALIRYILSNRSYRLHGASTVSPQKIPLKTRLGMTLRGMCARLPRAKAIFAADFLRPWHSFGLENLVLLQKTADDSRDWTFHARF